MSAIERTARYAAAAADHAARQQAFWSENAEKFRAQIATELPTWVQSIYDSTHIPPTTDQKQKMIANTRAPSKRAAALRANDNIMLLGAYNLI
jgi:hypothetical protein